MHAAGGNMAITPIVLFAWHAYIALSYIVLTADESSHEQTPDDESISAGGRGTPP
jgi:hypothetical protein